MLQASLTNKPDVKNKVKKNVCFSHSSQYYCKLVRNSHLIHNELKWRILKGWTEQCPPSILSSSRLSGKQLCHKKKGNSLSFLVPDVFFCFLAITISYCPCLAFPNSKNSQCKIIFLASSKTWKSNYV